MEPKFLRHIVRLLRKGVKGIFRTLKSGFEERYLERKFEQQYLQYKSQVRRWI
ncbi:MAG: hypothetical protein HYV00_04355 [Deltaproteobacteria bacterium]|nr:hypothetical protein [Deltaproteobacteria bacterium]MBI3059722.1 hypothetical protein [Deltaproteobacteria bacterium]